MFRLVLNPECDVSAIRQEVTRHVAGARQTRLFGRELAFVLPRAEVDR